MSNTAGPVIYIKNDLINEKYLAVVDSMVEKRLVKPSFKLLIEGLSTALLYAVHVDDTGSFVKFFDACDAIEGKIDPDYKTERPIQLGKITRYNRVKELEKKGFLQPFIRQEYIRELFPGRGASRLKAYTLLVPSIMQLKPAQVEKSDFSQRTSEYKAARKVESENAAQMEFGFVSKPVEKLGSLQILATYFSEFVRPDHTFSTKKINGTKLLRNPESGEAGKLYVETVSSTDTEIMVADDMVLLNYFYSSIQERLNEIKNSIKAPFENLFRFDKREILLDFRQSDSGGNRDVLDRQIKRLTNTKFNLEASKEALWLIKNLGIIDSKGVPYSKAPVQLLHERGEQIEAKKEDQDEMVAMRKSRRYVDVSLPSFIENLINEAIRELEQRRLVTEKYDTVPFLTMYDRDKRLLENEDKGLVWILNDYLSSMLARPGFKHGPIDLIVFTTRFNRTIQSKDDEQRISQLMLRVFSNTNLLLYVDGWQQNARKNIRFKSMYSLLDNKFLVYIHNTTPNYSSKARLSRISYSITIVRLDQSEAHECSERNALIRKNREYAEDELFPSYGKSIIERADAKASKFKRSKIELDSD
ncbi:hypothetical protein [Salinimonas chungwhensis]|uniref:hypothetical protein n=1 Tax=Salinimonas chungwhensis TaxID=265425 RepID=UPI0003619273|nr:hypothetical protein [Salinimonas chungwhensis]